METEYLDIVNKEILEIELFFKELYSPLSYSSSFRLPATYTPRLLPFLKPSQSERASRSLTDPADSETGSEAEERFVADLRERYKQLKVVQDQLHVELTRLRIWKLTTQPQQHALKSISAKPAPKDLKDMSTEMPIETTTGMAREALDSTTPKSTQTFKWVDFLLGLMIIFLWMAMIGASLGLFGKKNGDVKSSHTYPWPRS